MFTVKEHLPKYKPVKSTKSPIIVNFNEIRGILLNFNKLQILCALIHNCSFGRAVKKEQKFVKFLIKNQIDLLFSFLWVDPTLEELRARSQNLISNVA